MSHTARISVIKHAPANLKALMNLSASVKQSSLGERLVELVNLRISQINGCGFCVDMHWRDLIRQGADARHLNTVAAWRESPFFTERERAALRWVEIVNAQPHADASDDEFARVREHFSETEVVELGYAVAAIKAWNMLNLSLRNPVPEVPAPGF
ncbi:carboxymuconolactone decarboxylase family protein [Noviherbaspirillum sp. CPCC 100848]|uniref:Carboxymuconolactone decarboxylase family protein n=1 Tax=Noviherbaspirillum album TaxID=3080276 RepID=A0ABU6JF44_9BURK|nr:carboxymuconolactone decarboxylase family protein [Noviherbaspirillum sp. CPCC 100848]MEC4722076.1 carboxymuconolactone decarboxylase family protein [Noviherbaspirillum sp. CPCC 100848]